MLKFCVGVVFAIIDLCVVFVVYLGELSPPLVTGV